MTLVNNTFYVDSSIIHHLYLSLCVHHKLTHLTLTITHIHGIMRTFHSRICISLQEMFISLKGSHLLQFIFLKSISHLFLCPVSNWAVITPEEGIREMHCNQYWHSVSEYLISSGSAITPGATWGQGFFISSTFNSSISEHSKCLLHNKHSMNIRWMNDWILIIG